MKKVSQYQLDNNQISSGVQNRPSGLTLWTVVCFPLLLLVGPACSSTLNVTTTLELYAALANVSVERVVINGLLRVEAAPRQPILLGPNRAVEIVGTGMQNVTSIYHNNTYPVMALDSGIDFLNNGAGILALANNTTLTFRRLALWHSLSLLGYDFSVISLQPGARASVVFDSVAKFRDACLPQQIFDQHVRAYPRVNSTRGQQSAFVGPLCFEPPGSSRSSNSSNSSPSGSPSVAQLRSNTTGSGNSDLVCMDETLAVVDLATVITRSNGLSYNLYETNSRFWCDSYVSMSCLSANGPEMCVQQLLASMVNNSGSPGGPVVPPNAPPTGGDDGPVMGIVLPAVLTATLAILFVGGTVWCLRRRNQARSAPGGAGEGVSAVDVEAGAGGRRRQKLGALARLLPRLVHGRQDDGSKKGYIATVSREALEKIAKVRAELSSKMVVASSADDLSDVRVMALVGKGTFGRVYKAEWRGAPVALKVISVPVSQCGRAQWQQVLGEAAIATLLNHPNVLQTFSVALLEYAPKCSPPSSSADGRQEGDPIADSIDINAEHLEPFYQLKMVSEFCEGGTVVSALTRMGFYNSVGNGPARLGAILDIAAQVASGMAYLHSANIIHADLKAQNVLLKSQPGSGRLAAKVADFGLSFRMDDAEQTHATKGQLGSLTHMSPEVLMQGRVSKASDVYSFGILLFELYTGQQAYWEIPPPMLAYHVTTAGGRPHLPAHCPAPYKLLAEACWAAQPADRPTFKEAYEALRAMTSVTQHHLLHLPASATSPASPRSAASAAAAAAPEAAAAAAAAAAELVSGPGSADAAAAGVAPACASPKGPSAAVSATSVALAATAGGDGAAPGRLPPCAAPANGASGPSVAVTVLNVNAMSHNTTGSHSNRTQELQLLFESGSGAHGVRNGTGASSTLAVSSIPTTATAAAAAAAGHPATGSGANSANATARSGGAGGVASGGHSRTSQAAAAAFNAAVSSLAAAMAPLAAAAAVAGGADAGGSGVTEAAPAPAAAVVPLVQQTGPAKASDAAAAGERS